MEKNNWLSNNKTLSTRVTVNARSSTNKKQQKTKKYNRFRGGGAAWGQGDRLRLRMTNRYNSSALYPLTNVTQACHLLVIQEIQDAIPIAIRP